MSRRARAALVMLATGILAVVTPIARAQSPSDPDAAVAIVMRQLDAFRHDDFDTAYGFASATVHEIFDRGHFEAMVRGGYPEIARSAKAVVVDRAPGPSGNLYLRLEIFGTNGQTVEALYEMVWEDNAWRINSVVTRAVQGVLSRAAGAGR